MIHYNGENITHVYGENQDMSRIYRGKRLVFVRDRLLNIYGSRFIPQGISKKYIAKTVVNDVVSYSWTITNAESYFVDPENIVRITARSDNFNPIIIECTVTRRNGTTLHCRKEIEVRSASFSISLENIEINNTPDVSTLVKSHLIVTPAEYYNDYNITSASVETSEYISMVGYNQKEISFHVDKTNDGSCLIEVNFGAFVETVNEEEYDSYDAEAKIYFTNNIQYYILRDVRSNKKFNIIPYDYRNRIRIGLISNIENPFGNIYFKDSQNNRGISGIIEKDTGLPYMSSGPDYFRASYGSITWVNYNRTPPFSYIPPVAERTSDTISVNLVYSYGSDYRSTITIPQPYCDFENAYVTWVFRLMPDYSIIFDYSYSSKEPNRY